MDTILNFVPTGTISTKRMTPHVPISVHEVIEDVHAAHEVGITIVRLQQSDFIPGNASPRSGLRGR